MDTIRVRAISRALAVVASELQLIADADYEPEEQAPLLSELANRTRDQTNSLMELTDAAIRASHSP